MSIGKKRFICIGRTKLSLVINKIEDGLHWLNKELKSRGMNREDLERKGGPLSASLANAYRRKSVGVELADQIATGLGLPPEVVYREFGILPEKQKIDDEEAQIFVDLLNDIPNPERRKQTFNLVTVILRQVANETKQDSQTDRGEAAGKRSKKPRRAALAD